MTKLESADYLNRTHRILQQARAIAAIELPDVAGRTAYLAAYPAAQAFIFDRTGKVTKSRGGVRSEFARVAKGDPRIDRAFTAFLAQAYTLKEIADYGIGPDAGRDYFGSKTGHRHRRAVRRLHLGFNFIAKTNPEPRQRHEILRRPVAQTRIACAQFKRISFPSARSRLAANRSAQSPNL